TGPPFGDGARDADVAARAGAQLEHLADDAGRVDGGIGVGHGDDRGVAAQGGGPGAGLDRLRLLATGLAQVGVAVDAAGRDGTPARVERAGSAAARLEAGTDGDDRPVAHEHVGRPGAGAVD